MTSKSCFWKYSRINFNRRISYCIINFFLWMLILPVNMFFSVNMYLIDGMYEINERGLARDAANVVSGNSLMMFMTIASALLFALSGNLWNNNKSKIDFYKALPVKDRDRFIYIHLNSFIGFMISVVINMLLANLVFASTGISSGDILKHTVTSIVITAITFLDFYFVIVIAEYLTGNVLYALCASFVLICAEPVIVECIRGFKSLFFHTYIDILGRHDCYISPLNDFSRMYFRSVINGRIVDNDLSFDIVKHILHGVIYGVVAYLIYKKRNQTNEGKLITFKKTKPFIKVLVMFTGLLALSYLIGEPWDNMIAVTLVSIIILAIVLHFILQFIIECDLKALKKGWLSTIISAALAIIVFLSIALSAEKYDRYVPEKDDIASISVTGTYEWNLNFYNGDDFFERKTSDEVLHRTAKCTDRQIISKVVDAVQDALDRNIYYYNWNAYDDDEEIVYRDDITVVYNLKNGKRVQRNYCIAPERSKDIHLELQNCPEYVNATNQLTNEDNKKMMEIATDLCISYCNYGFWSYKIDGIKDEKDKQEIIKALADDHNLRTRDDYENNMPIGEITISASLDDYSNDFYIPIYECDNNTLAVLDRINIDIKKYKKDDVAVVKISKDIDYEEEWNESYVEEDYVFREEYDEYFPGDEVFELIADNAVLEEALWQIPYGEMGYNNKYYIYVVSEAGVEQGVRFLDDKFYDQLDELLD